MTRADDGLQTTATPDEKTLVNNGDLFHSEGN